MRYIIYGAGAIGGTIAAKLHMNGTDVAVIVRGEHLKAIRERGLTVRHNGEDEVVSIPAYAHPGELEFRPGDVAILTMKSQDTQAALEALRNAAGDQIPVVNCQNSIRNEEMALRLFSRVYGMVIFLPATHLEPGIVECNAWPVSGLLDLGRYPSGEDELSRRIASDLEAAGFVSQSTPDIMREKHWKLYTNLLNVHGTVCSREGTQDLGDRLNAEGEAVFDAAGIDWSQPEGMRERMAMVSRPSGSGSLQRSGNSTMQSLERGAGGIEVDYLTGEVCYLGRLHGIPTPVSEVFQLYANRMAAQKLPVGSISPDEIRAEIARRESAGVTIAK